MVRYQGNFFQQKLEIWSGAKVREISQLGRGAPHSPQKQEQKTHMGPKGPWAQFWAQGRRHEAAALEILALGGPYILLALDGPYTIWAASAIQSDFGQALLPKLPPIGSVCSLTLEGSTPRVLTTASLSAN